MHQNPRLEQGLPLWLVQAKCLSHYQANLVAPGEYDPDESLGKGDVMHLTCVDENGTTTALLIPGAFHQCIWLQKDKDLSFSEFRTVAQQVFQEAKITRYEDFEAVPVFSEGEQDTFFKVTFSAKSPKFAREARMQLEERLAGRVEICEKKYTPEARFVDEQDITFSGWFRVHNPLRVFELHQKTNEKIEYVCQVEDILSAPDLLEKPPPPLKLLSFDIETRNEKWEENVIPLPGNKKSSIYSVAITVHTVGTSKPERTYYVLVRPPKAPAELTEEFLLENTEFTHVNIVGHERHLVQRINDIFREESPLFITGHNIIRYDLPWIVDRANSASKLWGRRKGHEISYKSIQRDSGGLGKNDTFVFDTDRIILDLYPYMKENEKGLEDNRLDTIAKAILPQGGAGRKKVQVRYEDQFKIYTQSEKLEEHLLLANYVYTDADLVADILTTYTAVEKLIASSQVAKTPLEKMLGGNYPLYRMLDTILLIFNTTCFPFKKRPTSARLSRHCARGPPPRTDCQPATRASNSGLQRRLRSNSNAASCDQLRGKGTEICSYTRMLGFQKSLSVFDVPICALLFAFYWWNRLRAPGGRLQNCQLDRTRRKTPETSPKDRRMSCRVD